MTNYAYWQWANSLGTSPKPSIVNITDLETGYPEFTFFLDYYCNPDNQGAMSTENWNQFKEVKMYRDDASSTATNNMESLFYLPEAGADPPSSSLFNISTL